MMRKLACTLCVIVLAACSREADMEVRSFALNRLDASDAADILTPYVQEGGLITARGRVLTVRETPNRLHEIEQLLARLDGPPADVLLHFQLIEANGSTVPDPRIADVVETMRATFRYAGYRLLDEVAVSTTERSSFTHSRPGLDLRGELGPIGTSQGRQRVQLTFRAETSAGEISSTVGAALGETTIVGTQSRSGGALVLAVRPELRSAATAGARD